MEMVGEGGGEVYVLKSEEKKPPLNRGLSLRGCVDEIKISADD